MPVAAGADRPLERELAVAAHVHGESGLDGPVASGGERLLRSRTTRSRSSPERVAEADEPVTLVATGPADERRALPRGARADGIERIVIMGGAIAEGNFTPAAEFNIWCDPEAAAARVRERPRRDDDRPRRDAPGVPRPCASRSACAPRGEIGVFVADLNVYFTRYHRETYGWDGAPIHDAVAVAHVIDAGPRGDAPPERAGRARVGALPRPDGRRPLATHRSDAPNAHVGVRSTSTGSSSSSSSGSGASRERAGARGSRAERRRERRACRRGRARPRVDAPEHAVARRAA